MFLILDTHRMLLGARWRMSAFFSSLFKRLCRGFELGTLALGVLHFTTELQWTVAKKVFIFNVMFHRNGPCSTWLSINCAQSCRKVTNQGRGQKFYWGGWGQNVLGVLIISSHQKFPKWSIRLIYVEKQMFYIPGAERKFPTFFRIIAQM